MPVLKDHETTPTEISPGVFRKLIHLNDLMTVVIDFTNGPWEKPEPYHSHPHEQTCYVASGELIFYIDQEEYHLKEGDLVSIPSNVSHTVKILTKQVRLIDSFNPIREDFLK